jgi:hypothetical protein
MFDWFPDWLSDIFGWLVNTVWKPFAEFFGKFFKWWYVALLGVLTFLNTQLDAMHDKLQSFIDWMSSIDLSVFQLPYIGSAIHLLGQANYFLPLDTFFYCLASWLALMGICAVIRIAKNWLLENGW